MRAFSGGDPRASQAGAQQPYYAKVVIPGGAGPRRGSGKGFGKGSGHDGRARRIGVATTLCLLLPALLALGATQVLGGGRSNADTVSYSLFGATEKPNVASANDSHSVELGVRFSPDVDGYATGVRFYKGPSNSGSHVGTLWTANGTQLARVSFSGESATGWQSASFSTPVALTAAKSYVVSYHANNGGYAETDGYFTKSYDTGVLSMPAESASAGNGLYKYGNRVAFPTGHYRATNYWVDVTFKTSVDAPTTTPPTTVPSTKTVSLFSNSITPQTIDSGDALAVELGVKFTADVNGWLSGVQFYKSAANSGTHTGSLWSASGALLATATFTNESASGWQEVAFSSPVPVTAGATYTVSYHTNAGHESFDQYYFASQLDVPPLHAPASDAAGGNGVYTYGSGGFPTSTWRQANYWVDPVFTMSTSGGTTPTTVAPTTTTVAPTTTTVAPTTTTGKPTTTTVAPTPPPSPPAAGYVLPGSVGYLGAASALTTYNVQAAGTQVTIAGHVWTWQTYGLRNDDATVALDHVRINGSIAWYGATALTITNSIVDNTAQRTGPAVAGRSSGRVIASDSTFTGAAPLNSDVAAIWPNSGYVQLNRVALSGFPQGADPSAPGSYVKNSWIRSALNGTAHIDGIFDQGGSNVEVSGNYIDGTATNPTGSTIYPVTAGIFLQNYQVAGATMTGVSIHDNFINMYGYPGPNLAVRNQSGSGVNFFNNTLQNGQNVTAEVQGSLAPAGTWGTCTGNVHPDGTRVPCSTK